jgi:hypothetical protein
MKSRSTLMVLKDAIEKSTHIADTMEMNKV